METSLIIFIAVTFLLAGFVKGVIGLGLPTIAIGVLGVVMAPAQAAALLAIPNIATNGWQIARGPGLAAIIRRLWPMLAGLCLGTFAASGLLQQQKNGGAAFWLGLALIAYALIGVTAARLRVPPRSEIWLAPLVGLATGVSTAATGVFVLPAVPYLQALGLDKDELVQALGLSFLVSTLALSVGLIGTGMLDWSTAFWSVLALAPALVGMALGTAVRSRISAAAFRSCFFFGLLALGIYLVWRNLA
ncbi:MAG: sulfite exporter TauE/SafE family protein [Bosea sp. (in: a-proteobacteria)]